jgi:hypothetical protein
MFKVCFCCLGGLNDLNKNTPGNDILNLFFSRGMEELFVKIIWCQKFYRLHPPNLEVYSRFH